MPNASNTIVIVLCLLYYCQRRMAVVRAGREDLPLLGMRVIQHAQRPNGAGMRSRRLKPGETSPYAMPLASIEHHHDVAHQSTVAACVTLPMTPPAFCCYSAVALCSLHRTLYSRGSSHDSPRSIRTTGPGVN